MRLEWNSGTVIVKCVGTVEHTVAESIIKNVGTVAQCHSDSNQKKVPLFAWKSISSTSFS